MSTQPAPRLHLLFARDAPSAVILRRGPSAWYHVIRWHMRDDRFEHGAWFRGRIYEERCDLSPDGELLIYFALQGSRWVTSYRGSWTAVSRAPWLHALTLWPEGSTWGGGGYFAGDRTVVIQSCRMEVHPDHPVHGLEVRTGARAPRTVSAASTASGWCGDDLSGEPIFTRDGRIYRGAIDGNSEVADLNGLVPAPSDAPEWAKQPLETVRARKRRLRRKARNRIRRSRSELRAAGSRRRGSTPGEPPFRGG